MDFPFIFDSQLRKIAERDYAELQNLDPRRATKSVITLSGSIIEGLLFDALVASGKWTFEKACENNLKNMITVAHASGIITEDRLTDAVRNSRNLIHPGREIRDNVVFDETDAEAAKVAVKIVIREVRTWAASERQRRKITAFLSKLNPDQIEFLQLFALPKPPASAQYEHPFLKFSIYDSTCRKRLKMDLAAFLCAQFRHGQWLLKSPGSIRTTLSADLMRSQELYATLFGSLHLTSCWNLICCWIKRPLLFLRKSEI